ncbi:MAG TPA: carbonic anhydrase [Candidatus Didemnitutus sp.]|nr:carbonic anhydrase [Candidatus Didemnitutus sp.]
MPARLQSMFRPSSPSVTSWSRNQNPREARRSQTDQPHPAAQRPSMKNTSLNFCSRAVIAAGAFLALAVTLSASCGPSPDQALSKVMEGNARFAAGKAIHPDQTAARRIEQAKAQTPFAIVLTCADSRVAPEMYFDQGIGDLFVIRNAGNILDDHVFGSIEYAVEHLHVSLILVVGHDKCGAVTAAIEDGEAPGHIPSIVNEIAPFVPTHGTSPTSSRTPARWSRRESLPVT